MLRHMLVLFSDLLDYIILLFLLLTIFVVIIINIFYEASLSENVMDRCMGLLQNMSVC